MAARKGRRNPALFPSNDLVLVKITGFVRSSRYGDLETGDFLRIDKAFAKHLVEEAKAARYVMATKNDRIFQE